MSETIEEALANCIERLESGEISPEQALNLYPELRAELEPLLALTAELRAMTKVQAPSSLRGYKRPVFRAAQRREAWWRRLLPTSGPSLGWATPLAQAAAILGILLVAGGGTMVAAASSLPDEPLYPVKLAVENAQLALAANDQARAQLELQQASKRLSEVETAAHQGRSDAVTKGVELYQQKAEAAAKASESVSPSTNEQVQDSLRNNVEVLKQVEQRVGNDQAKAAIQRAIDRSLAASNNGRGPRDKEDEQGGKPAVAAAPTATSTPRPAVSSAATSTSVPTASPTPSLGHEPPGQAKGRPDEPGNSGQVVPQGQEPKNQGQESRDQGQGQGQGQRQRQQETIQDAPQPAVVVPSATPAQPASHGVGKGLDRGDGQGQKETGPASDSATPEKGPKNANDNKASEKGPKSSDDRGNDNQKKDLFSNLIEQIQKMVGRR